MKSLLWLLVVCPLVSAQDQSTHPSCVIIKHASVARQAFVSGANWQYVAGEFPSGMKWKSNVTDRYVRKIKAAGGKVVTVNQQYTDSELDAAKKECEAAK